MTGMRERPRNELGTPEHPVRAEPLAIVSDVATLFSDTELARGHPEDIVARIAVRQRTAELHRPRVAARSGWRHAEGRKRQRPAAGSVGGTEPSCDERNGSLDRAGGPNQRCNGRRVKLRPTGTQAPHSTLDGERAAFEGIRERQKVNRKRSHSQGHERPR